MNSNELLNDIFTLYDEYVNKVNELERNRKITDGLFGITKGPEDDPCHDVFADDLKTKLSEFSSSDPSSAEVFSLLKFTYEAPLKYRDNKMIYWMFSAVHALSNNLISRLEKGDAQKLYAQYTNDFPRWERLPSQKQTLKEFKNFLQ